MEKLTRQEEDVMQVVWRLGNCTVREVLRLRRQLAGALLTLKLEGAGIEQD